MDLWPKQTGNIAGSKLHGKLAAHSGAVCLKDGGICLFWRGSPALMLLWLYDQMTLFTRSGNSNWHTLQLLSPTSDHRWSAAAARGSVVPSGHMSQLVQLQLQMPLSLLSSWNTQTLYRQVQGCVGGDGHKLPVLLSIWTTLHPVCQSWPDLVSLTDVTGSGCEWSVKRVTDSDNIMALFNCNFLFLMSV